MNSTLDLRDALDETEPARAVSDVPTTRCMVCVKCLVPPLPGSKLRHCGGCKSGAFGYCSKACARAAWPVHKLVCRSFGEQREEQLAAHRCRGGRASTFDHGEKNISAWLTAVPGLISQIQLLAWTARRESPVIHAIDFKSDVSGRALQLQMELRSSWDREIRTHTSTAHDHGRVAEFVGEWPVVASKLLTNLRNEFDDASFCPDKQYMLNMTLVHQDRNTETLSMCSFERDTIRCAEIVEALTAATRAADLAEAIAWIAENQTRKSLGAQEVLQFFRDRAALLLGVTALPDSPPIPSRALNNEVACQMISLLHLEFSIRLTGLLSASHLNGREGVIIREPVGLRWKARLDDGTYVDVKAINFVHICGNYKRRTTGWGA